MADVMTRIKLRFVHAFRDRHGQVRHYFRRGGKRIPLPGLPGSAGFMAAYEAALANMAARKEIGASRTKPGTVNAAIVGYYTSLAFRELAPGTQIGTRERLAFELLLCTAQRRSDVVRMGPQHVRGDALHVRQDKTGAQLVIPIHADLQAALSAMRATHPASSSRAIRPLTFITSKSGRQFSGNDFSTLFRTWCDAAGLPRRCTAHGLRKAAARRLAERGATTHQIAAITGHRSLGEVQRYTRAADQARLAREAMELISPKTEHQSGKPRNQSGKPN
jgi:integrase